MIFKAQDNTRVEIIHHQAEQPRAILIFGPGMGGNARAYRLPYHKFLKKNISVAFYNPRAHGSSGGVFSFEKAREDLELWYQNEIKNLPVIACGHSGGALNMLKWASNSAITFKGLFLASPILDSAESLHFMKRIQTLQEFSELIYLQSGKREVIKDLLSDNEWLENWHIKNLRKKIRQSRATTTDTLTDTAQFLENTFIPSVQGFNELFTNRHKSFVYLSAADNWFDYRLTKQVCDTFNISVKIIDEAEDHFFKNGKHELWRQIEADIDKL